MRKITLLLTICCLCFSTTKAQWANQNSGFTNKTLGFYEISIVDENVVWAICYDGIGGLFGSAHILDFTRTTDGGANWMPGTVGSDTTLAFSNICALSDTEAWVAMHKFNFSGGGGIFHTTDAGATWTQSNPGVLFNDGSFPNFVYFKDALNGIAGGDANGSYFEIYTTTDGGNNWTRTPQANMPDFLPGGQYGWFDGYCVVGDTVWFGTNLGQMYKSTDFGNTWSISTVSPIGDTVYEIAFDDAGVNGLTHVRSNTETMLFATSDGGATWTQRPTHPFWKQSRLTAVRGTNKFVSTSVINSNRGSAYTADLGITWIEIDATAPKAACRFLDSNTGWAGGFFNDNPLYVLSGGLYKWDNSVSLGTTQNQYPDNACSVYPNPAKDKLNIKFSDDASHSLRFYNDVGMLIKEVNTTSTEIDISDLPGGVYFIRSANDPRINAKFIKV